MRPASSTTVRTTTLARSGGGTRTLVHLEPEGRRRFAGTVAPVAGRIEDALGPNVLAARTRIDRASRGQIHLFPWRPARRRFHLVLDGLTERSEALAITDVRACYASIEPRVLAARLRELGCGRGEVQPILRFLGGLHETGVDGLPIGPAPSAVLANAVLGAVDEAVAGPGVRHLRWVDDLVMFGRTEAHARRALDRAGNALAEIGLRPAPEKTTIADAREAAKDAGRGLSMSRGVPGREL